MESHNGPGISQSAEQLSASQVGLLILWSDQSKATEENKNNFQQ
jgi:hypothetical protein